MEGMNTEQVPWDLDMSYLDTYVYECVPGYESDDEMVTLCQADGSQSLMKPPNCTGMYRCFLVTPYCNRYVQVLSSDTSL